MIAVPIGRANCVLLTPVGPPVYQAQQPRLRLADRLKHMAPVAMAPTFAPTGAGSTAEASEHPLKSQPPPPPRGWACCVGEGPSGRGLIAPPTGGGGAQTPTPPPSGGPKR